MDAMSAAPGRPLGRLGTIQVRGTTGALLLGAWLTLVFHQVLTFRFPGWSSGSLWLVAVLIAAAMGGSVLLHEYGHALAGRWCGLRVRWIVVDALGGETEFDRDAPGPGRAAGVAAAGPAVSVLLVVAFALAERAVGAGSLTGFALGQLALGNAIVAVFNLLPGLPLDGGHVLRALIWALTGRERTGATVAGVVGLVTAAAIVLLPLALVLDAGARPGLLGIVILVVVAAPVARGAVAALQQSPAPGLTTLPPAYALSAPALVISANQSVQEALRLVTARAGAALVVTRPDGSVAGLVSEVELAAVPLMHRGGLAVGAVTAPLQPTQVIPGWLAGEPLLEHVRGSGARIFLLGDAPPYAPRVLIADRLRAQFDALPVPAPRP